MLEVILTYLVCSLIAGAFNCFIAACIKDNGTKINYPSIMFLSAIPFINVLFSIAMLLSSIDFFKEVIRGR